MPRTRKSCPPKIDSPSKNTRQKTSNTSENVMPHIKSPKMKGVNKQNMKTSLNKSVTDTQLGLNKVNPNQKTPKAVFGTKSKVGDSTSPKRVTRRTPLDSPSNNINATDSTDTKSSTTQVIHKKIETQMKHDSPVAKKRKQPARIAKSPNKKDIPTKKLKKDPANEIVEQNNAKKGVEPNVNKTETQLVSHSPKLSSPVKSKSLQHKESVSKNSGKVGKNGSVTKLETCNSKIKSGIKVQSAKTKNEKLDMLKNNSVNTQIASNKEIEQEPQHLSEHKNKSSPEIIESVTREINNPSIKNKKSLSPKKSTGKIKDLTMNESENISLPVLESDDPKTPSNLKVKSAIQKIDNTKDNSAKMKNLKSTKKLFLSPDIDTSQPRVILNGKEDTPLPVLEIDAVNLPKSKNFKSNGCPKNNKINSSKKENKKKNKNKTSPCSNNNSSTNVSDKISEENTLNEAETPSNISHPVIKSEGNIRKNKVGEKTSEITADNDQFTIFQEKSSMAKSKCSKKPTKILQLKPPPSKSKVSRKLPKNNLTATLTDMDDKDGVTQGVNENKCDNFLRVEHEYIAEGFKEDCEMFIKKCQCVSKLNFEKFGMIWKSMGFTHLYRGRQSAVEIAELSEELIFVAKSYMIATNRTFEVNVAGLFLVYALLNLQPYKNFAVLRLVPEDVPAILTLEAEARRQKRLDIVYILGHVLIVGPCQFHVLARECAIEHPARKYYDGTVVPTDASTLPIGVLSNNTEALSLLKTLSILDQKYSETKKKLQESVVDPDPSLNFASNAADELQDSLQDLIPDFLMNLDTSPIQQRSSAKKKQLSYEVERHGTVQSIKDKAMANVVNSMKHLTGINERNNIKSPPNLLTSPVKGKRKSGYSTTAKMLNKFFAYPNEGSSKDSPSDSEITSETLLEMTTEELNDACPLKRKLPEHLTRQKIVKAKRKSKHVVKTNIEDASLENSAEFNTDNESGLNTSIDDSNNDTSTTLTSLPVLEMVEADNDPKEINTEIVPTSAESTANCVSTDIKLSTKNSGVNCKIEQSNPKIIETSVENEATLSEFNEEHAERMESSSEVTLIPAIVHDSSDNKTIITIEIIDNLNKPDDIVNMIRHNTVDSNADVENDEDIENSEKPEKELAANQNINDNKNGITEPTT